MTISRFWLFFLLINSLFFLIGASVLLQGVGLTGNPGACNIVQLFCITFYFVTKGAAYSLFLEKVYAVWPNRGSRLTSTAYKVGFVALIGFLALLGLFIYSRDTHIRDDGECVIGSGNSVTLIILLVDVGLNVLLTSLFLVPLMRVTHFSPQVRKVAVRNFIASTLCFISSVANLTALAALHGHEVAWLCVTSCTIDITINALIAFWVTRPPSQSEYSHGTVSPAITWKRHTRGEMDADEVILTRFGEGVHIDLTTSTDRSVSTRHHPESDPDSDSMHPTYGSKSLPPIGSQVPSFHSRKDTATFA
jgi:hypothetical protein